MLRSFTITVGCFRNLTWILVGLFLPVVPAVMSQSGRVAEASYGRNGWVCNIPPPSMRTGYSVIEPKDVTKDVPPNSCGPYLRWELDRFSDRKIPYKINRKGSKDLSLPEIKATAEKAFQTWKNIVGVSLDFRFDGYTDNSGLVKDGENVISFDEARSYFTDADNTEVFAKTKYVDFVPNGQLLEVDIVINGTYFRPRTAHGCDNLLSNTH